MAVKLKRPLSRTYLVTCPPTKPLAYQHISKSVEVVQVGVNTHPNNGNVFHMRHFVVRISLIAGT